MTRAKQKPVNLTARGEVAPRPRRTPANPNELTPDSMVRLAELQKHVPLSRTSIYRLVSAGDFPRPRQLGTRTTAWRWGDVLEWLRAREATAGSETRGAA